MIRLGKQITTHLAAMKDVYNKLETLQAECAVTRTSRLTHYHIKSQMLPNNRTHKPYMGLGTTFINPGLTSI